jgi:hypothetical protein
LVRKNSHEDTTEIPTRKDKKRVSNLFKLLENTLKKEE